MSSPFTPRLSAIFLYVVQLHRYTCLHIHIWRLLNVHKHAYICIINAKPTFLNLFWQLVSIPKISKMAGQL